MNPLDRAIAAVSPQWALKRARNRAALNIFHKRYGTGYEGASGGRRTAGWRRPATDVNSEIRGAAARLRQSSRDLVRNTPWAGSAVRRFVTSAVGTGIRGEAKSSALNDQWMEWTKSVSGIGPMSFAGFQALVLRAVIESGEVLVWREVVREGDRRVLKLRVMETDHLDYARDVTPRPDGTYVHGGIEYDRRDRPIAYWILPRHPGESGSVVRVGRDSVRVDASEILHIYESARPAQQLGASWFAPVITKLHEIKDYDDAELMRAKVQSLFGAFITNLEGDPIGVQSGSDETADPQLEGLQAGYISYLQPGENVEFGQPNVTLGYDQFMRTQLLSVAANFGMSYEVLTGDLSNVNFSSARMGLLEFRRRVEEVQQNMMIPMLCEPVFVWWLQTTDRMIATERHWYPMAFEAIQPKEDAEARQIEVRSGFRSLREVVQESGKDFTKHMADLAEVNTTIDELDLTLDSDARKTQRSGAVQSEGSDDSPDDAGGDAPRPAATNGDARAH